MALLEDHTGGAAVGTAIPQDGLNKVYVKKTRFDMANVAGTPTSTDVFRVIDIPAGTMVLSAWFNVVTAEATNPTAQVSLGDGTQVAGFVAAATVAAAGLHVPAGSETYQAYVGEFYTAADTLDLVVSVAALTEFVCDVYALCVDLG